MAGSLDTALKRAAKTAISTLGVALDTKITYIRIVLRPYDPDTSTAPVYETKYKDIYVTMTNIVTAKESTAEKSTAQVYLTPNLIGDNQPTTADKVLFTFAGNDTEAKIDSVDTYKGGQTYFHILNIVF